MDEKIKKQIIAIRDTGRTNMFDTTVLSCYKIRAKSGVNGVVIGEIGI